MEHVFISIVNRTAQATESHGALLKIDWETKSIIQEIEAPPIYDGFAGRDRGGRRGFKGITRYDGLIYAATFDSLYGFHPETLELESIITHPYMGGLHEIEGTKDGIWVASTPGAGVFLIDKLQNIKAESWIFDKPTIDLRIPTIGKEERFHINTVYIAEDESVYAYANSTGQLFKMFPNPPKEVAVLEKGAHNVMNTELGWFRNASEHAIVRIGKKELKMPAVGEEGLFTKPGWVRGMARLSNGNFLVGNSPASVFEIDPVKMEILDSMQIRHETPWCVHGIYVDGADHSAPTVVRQTFFGRKWNVWTEKMKEMASRFRYRSKIYIK